MTSTNHIQRHGGADGGDLSEPENVGVVSIGEELKEGRGILDWGCMGDLLDRVRRRLRQ